MDFTYSEKGELLWHGEPVATICAQEKRSFYLYHGDFLRKRLHYFTQELQKKLSNPLQVHFAVKANNSENVLREVHAQNIGVDVVSGGELEHCLKLGFSPNQLVFSGVGKTKDEITRAVELGISQLNVESLPEVQRLIQIAEKLKKPMRVGVRFNPDVPVETHPYIATGLRDNKFGVDLSQLKEISRILLSHPLVKFSGLSIHIGSQILDFSPLEIALQKSLQVIAELNSQGHQIESLDVGGGVGIDYQSAAQGDESHFQSYAEVLAKVLQKHQFAGKILFEPGRFLVGRAGALLSPVEYVKKSSEKTFVILQSGMNHLLRPALYQAQHRIFPVLRRSGQTLADVVGPVCESSDVFAKDLTVTSLQEGDWVLIADSGAYGVSMASDYNMFPRPQEKWISPMSELKSTAPH